MEGENAIEDKSKSQLDPLCVSFLVTRIILCWHRALQVALLCRIFALAAIWLSNQPLLIFSSMSVPARRYRLRQLYASAILLFQSFQSQRSTEFTNDELIGGRSARRSTMLVNHEMGLGGC